MQFQLKAPPVFDLDLTMDSEQCPGSFFFWNREADRKYSRLCQHEETFYKLTLSQETDWLKVKLVPQVGASFAPDVQRHAEQLIYHQFRFDDDFRKISEAVAQWPEIGHQFYTRPGLRLMRDVDLFSRIVDSICSQNTSIKHLNRMMENLAMKLGDKIVLQDGTSLHSLPNVETVANSSLFDLQECGLGYRAKYLLNSAKMLIQEPEKWQKLNDLPLAEAESQVRLLPGVGPKVAALILMFGFGRTDVFAVDVWVLRGVQTFFNWDGSPEKIKNIAEKEFGDLSAYINNYIFYSFRKGFIKYAVRDGQPPLL